MEESSFFSTPGNPSFDHQEVVSYVISEPPTNKSRSLTAAIFNVANNVKLDGKPTITQEEGYSDCSRTHVEEALSETP